MAAHQFKFGFKLAFHDSFRWPRGGVRTTLGCSAAAYEAVWPVDDHISSTGNAYVKHCVNLRTNRKYRHEHSRTLLCGLVAIQEHLSLLGHSQVERVVAVDATKVPEGLRQARRVTTVTPRVFKKIAGVHEPASLHAVVELSLPKMDLLANRSADVSKLLILEGVQDPGNLGTLVRTAVAMGWDAVCLSSGCCDPFSDKAIRASRGATLRTLIGAGEWSDIAAFCRDRGLLLLAAAPADSHKRSAEDAAVGFDALARLQKAKVALVLGSEGQGLREATLRECIPVGIPMTRGMESLNVGVAGAIYMALFSPCLGIAVRDVDMQVREAGSAAG